MRAPRFGLAAIVATLGTIGGGARGAAAADAKSGMNFIGDAKLLYAVAGCSDARVDAIAELAHGDAAKAAAFTKVVDHHCKVVHAQMDKFRDVYFDKGRAWFDAVVPKDVPKTVVYPFGGGDLISALVAFPDATEITTISLELAGDPRRIGALTPAQLESSLGALRVEIGGLVSVGSNTSENLSAGQRNELPSQVSSFLLGLVAGGYEPVAMRYFTLDDHGQVHYLEAADIDAADRDAARRAKKLKSDWQSPSFSDAFANVEIEYRKVGESQLRVHRHIGWNLGDPYLTKHGELLRHLEAKGKVTILTKGGSYMLWRSDFAQIRDYLLAHAAWMLSDSTGVPPPYAKKAGMVQETYGDYDGAFLEQVQGDASDQAFMALWHSQPRRKLPFRFGYVDRSLQAHLVVTRPR